MTEILDPVIQMKPDLIQELEGLSDDDLVERARLVKSAHTNCTLYMVKVIAVADKRGIDFVERGLLSATVVGLLRKVGSGQLDLDLAGQHLWTQPGLLQELSVLPLIEQKKIARGEPVSVAERAADGTMCVRQVPMEKLPVRVRRRLIRSSGIPEPLTQFVGMEREEAEPPRPDRDPPYTILRDTNSVLVGKEKKKVLMSAGFLERFLKELRTGKRK